MTKILILSITLFIAGYHNFTMQIQNQSENAFIIHTSQTPQFKPYIFDHNFFNWQGSWQMGDESKYGSNGDLIIKNVTASSFDFSISASIVSSFENEQGNVIENVYTGDLEGKAVLKSSKEAWHTSEDYTDYKIVFKLINDNTIKLAELNTTTNEDYGLSPMAGLNVRFAGTYKKTN
jgi:hypothetical protein